MKNLIVLVCLVLTMVSCAKKAGMTSSKIKILGANAFNVGGTLAAKANNGLFFYGKSADGKSFLKKIDTDAIDLVFPNGTWNFYAVSWEDANQQSLFIGKTYCGKSEGNILNGSDVAISLNLSNANCSDLAFSSAPYNSGSAISFPHKNYLGCKDLSTVTDYNSALANCTRDKNNRGYATFMEVFVPQYKNFGNGIEEYDPSAKSFCVAINPTDPYSMVNQFLSSQDIHLPDSKNGFETKLRLYYGIASPCDPAGGVDELVTPLNDTPRSKTVLALSAGPYPMEATSLVVYQSNDAQVCQSTAGVTTDFAGGYGVLNSPFVICTPAQFNKISDGFISSDYKTYSFELASDLDFNFGTFKPIGDPITISNPAQPIPFQGSFFGNNHTIRNIFLKNTDKNIVGGRDVGLIRRIAGVGTTVVRDLTINKMATVGFEGFDNVGLLAGDAADVLIKNVKVFGHVEGSSYVGGVVGNYSGSMAGMGIESTHAEVDINYKISLTGMNSFAGGITGEVLGNSGLPVSLKNVSFKGKITSNGGGDERYLEVSSTDNALITTNTSYSITSGSSSNDVYINQKTQSASRFFVKINLSQNAKGKDISNLYVPGSTTAIIVTPIVYSGVGGIAGGATNVILNNATVKSDLIAGEINLGGIAGYLDTSTVSNTIAESNLESNAWGIDLSLSGSGTGGSFGYLVSSTVNNTLALGYQVFDPSDIGADGYAGFVDPGIPTTTPITNYFVGNAQNLNPTYGLKLLGAPPGITNSLFKKLTYSPSMFYDFWGAGAPTAANTVGATGTKTYYDYIEDACYSSSGSMVVTWTKITCGASGGWIMPVDGLIPRLAYELHEESKVPYLKRQCTTPEEIVLATPLTAADGGSIICSLAQLTPKAAGAPADHLGQNIYFYSAATPMSNKFLDGIYKLNGEGHSIVNYIANADGMFSNLLAGSEISNLKLIGSKLDLSTTTPGNSIGVLAKSNAGNIINVTVDLSDLNVDTSKLSSSSPFYIGGLVGTNTGTITASTVGTFTNITGEKSTGNSSLYYGNIAGYSSGTINAVSVRGSISRINFSTSLAGIAYPEYGGGVVGLADGGLISETSAEGSLNFNCTSAPPATVNAAPVYGLSTSSAVTVRDFYTNTHVSLSSTSNNLSLASGFNLKQGYGNFVRGIMVIDDQSLVTNITTSGYTVVGTDPNVLFYYRGGGTLSPSIQFEQNLTFNNGAGTGITYLGRSGSTTGFTNWNMGKDFVNSILNGNIWRLDFMGQSTSTELPKLVKTDGSFEEIGKGF